MSSDEGCSNFASFLRFDVDELSPIELRVEDSRDGTQASFKPLPQYKTDMMVRVAGGG